MNGETKRRLVARTLAVALAVSACGGFPKLGEPVGDPLLPDLVPEPPVDLRVQVEDGVTTVRFSSTLVNVGEGDFVLRADRTDDGWDVQQEVSYSESGGDLIHTDADMVWGGDGHDHWHVKRVAQYRLVALDDEGEPIDEDLGYDTKIGFCFFDHDHALSFGPKEPLYQVHDCGHEDDNQIRVGMQTGWADIYGFGLPGQSIDISGLPDGFYRVWAEADPGNWFSEVNTANNSTWIDFELETRDDLRFAVLTDVGPRAKDR